MDWRLVFSGLSSATSATRAISELVRKRRGTERALLLELQKNISLVFLWRNDGVAVEKVIARLETRQFESAVQANFDFNNLAKRPISRDEVKGAAALSPYVGWSTEQLLERIFLRIHELKTLVELGSRHAPVRHGVRLNNLLKLMLLLVKHIRRRSGAR